MSANLYTHQIKGELKRSLKGLIIWTSVVLLLTIMAMSFYPAMAESSAELISLLENMPQGLLKGMGMDDSMMTSALGFYKVYYGSYIIVIMGIYLFATGANLFAKEESEQTIEFMMSKPISRKQYFMAKTITAFMLFATIVIVQSSLAGIAILMVDKNPFYVQTFMVFHLNGALLVLFFLAMGILVSMLLNPRTNYMGLAVGLVFGSYFVEALAQGIGTIEWLGKISPFHYADFNILQTDYSINFVYLCITLLIAAGFIIVAFKRFEKRDFVA